MWLKIVLVTVTDVAFVHLTLFIEDQDDVIRASGAPSETKVKVPKHLRNRGVPGRDCQQPMKVLSFHTPLQSRMPVVSH